MEGICQFGILFHENGSKCVACDFYDDCYEVDHIEDFEDSGEEDERGWEGL
jgi:hypothetical protein